ncbi:zinc phosphodiesterase [Tritrichomonas foetus]|uniref:ribonuclease Z n=1 Tax=Tritrichomonas foetus TaxID=1144522 RepID=A0A1J4JRR0_9EUKA|nr:zinc phosphodiesterase [Tritrichomonas foetus]|eukprot:OHT01120.1 zinc phosphodiesterase [Tritrichomonas foetus]
MHPTIHTLMGRGYDANPSLALIVKGQVFLFNAPPLVYRAFLDSNISNQNIKATFVTNCTPQCISGYVHLLFDNFYGETTNLTIHAPKDFLQYFCTNPEILKSKIVNPKVLSNYESPTFQVRSIELSKSLSYVADIHYTESIIDQSKLNKLGIAKGFWIGQLRKTGKANVDGKDITFNDVFSTLELKYKILFVDIQKETDIQILHDSIPDFSIFDMIVHFTPQGLLNDAYFNSFPEKVKNFCFCEDAVIMLEKAAAVYSVHSKCDLNLFPLLPSGIKRHLKLPPHFVSLSSKDIIKFETMEINKPEETQIIESSLPCFSNYALTFLGTSSGFQTAYRSVSGILLHLNNNGFVILDCGNGFYQQLRRKYGPTNALFVLQHLKCIWISHRHSDHVLGIIDILDERCRISNNKVILACDELVKNEIALKERAFNTDFKIKYVNRAQPISINDYVIDSVPVTHCENSMGCVITLNNGYRIGYTGDMFDDGAYLQGVGKCNLLISEGTYANNKVHNCKKYNHMTMSQALNLQESLGAEYLIMVHASASLPTHELNIRKENAIFAFDYLCIPDDKINDIFQKIKSIRY